MVRLCSVEGCMQPHRARGLCSTHWRQEHGQPAARFERQCENCATTYLASKHGGRFCSYICRDLYRIEHPYRFGPQLFCRIPANHPSQWYGAITVVPWKPCLECGALIIRRGNRRYCGPCAAAIDYARRQQRRSSRWSHKRARIFERDGWWCWICSGSVDPSLAIPHPQAASVDHLIPSSIGGSDDDDNLACAHLSCNSSRGNALTY